MAKWFGKTFSRVAFVECISTSFTPRLISQMLANRIAFEKKKLFKRKIKQNPNIWPVLRIICSLFESEWEKRTASVSLCMEKLINRVKVYWKINEKVKSKQKLKFTDKSLLLFAEECANRTENTERAGKERRECASRFLVDVIARCACANSKHEIEFMANGCVTASFNTLSSLDVDGIFVCKQTSLEPPHKL